jgi:hypothetical protein
MIESIDAFVKNFAQHFSLPVWANLPTKNVVFYTYDHFNLQLWKLKIIFAMPEAQIKKARNPPC